MSTLHYHLADRNTLTMDTGESDNIFIILLIVTARFPDFLTTVQD